MMENSLPALGSAGSGVTGTAGSCDIRPIILIVEDEAVPAEDLRETLQEYGYQVCTIASTGEEAMAEFSARRPDLIIMDINLPGAMDGIDVASRITRDFPVPVVYLTAYFDEETITRATNTNPYGFLVKPFSKETIHSTIHSTIQVALARNRLDRSIRGSREWIDLTLRNIDQGIIVLNTEGRIVLANSCAERLLGVHFTAIHGNAFIDEIRFHDAIFNERYIPPVLSVLDEGLLAIIPSDILLVSGRGETIRIKNGTISPVLDNQGAVHGALFIFTTDIGPKPEPLPGNDPADRRDAERSTTDPVQGFVSPQRITIREIEGDIAISPSLEKANLCVLRGKYEEAIGIYDQMLRSDPDNFQIWHNRGMVQANLGRHGEALQSFDRALAVNPDSDQTHHRRTEVHTILSVKRRRD